MQIISRAEAKAKGLKRYIAACCRGHVTERPVHSHGGCNECRRLKRRRSRACRPSHLSRVVHRLLRSRFLWRCLIAMFLRGILRKN